MYVPPYFVMVLEEQVKAHTQQRGVCAFVLFVSVFLWERELEIRKTRRNFPSPMTSPGLGQGGIVAVTSANPSYRRKSCYGYTTSLSFSMKSTVLKTKTFTFRLNYYWATQTGHWLLKGQTTKESWRTTFLHVSSTPLSRDIHALHSHSLAPFPSS